ncbi:hypothetical protein HOY80DRAFT_858876, partial [Tuber brumale]
PVPPQLLPSSKQVAFADREGKQCVCILVILRQITKEFIDSEVNGQRDSVTINAVTGRVDYAESSIR